MRQNKYFLIGITLSILIHILVFIAFNIKVKIPIKHQYIVYIKSIKQQTNKTIISKNNLSKSNLKTKKPKKQTYKSYKSYKSQKSKSINYNKTIPSFKELSKNYSNINSKPKSQKPIPIKPKNKPSTLIKPSPKPTKSNNSLYSTQKEKNPPKIKYKHIAIIGYSIDLIDYLERVFKYIHENCKGNAVLEVSLYKDGTMNIKVVNGNALCSKNLQAPPMPNSVMENQIDFLLYNE